jgi:hypothetical protein
MLIKTFGSRQSWTVGQFSRKLFALSIVYSLVARLDCFSAPLKKVTYLLGFQVFS